MELSFATGRLRKLCEQEKTARMELGKPGADKLRVRLADLAAASSVNELVAGRPHPLQGDRAGQFSVDLDGGRRLVFSPDHDPVPRKADEGIDWSSVTKVRIEFVGDYHG